MGYEVTFFLKIPDFTTSFSLFYVKVKVCIKIYKHKCPFDTLLLRRKRAVELSLISFVW